MTKFITKLWSSMVNIKNRTRGADVLKGCSQNDVTFEEVKYTPQWRELSHSLMSPADMRGYVSCEQYVKDLAEFIPPYCPISIEFDGVNR